MDRFSSSDKGGDLKGLSGGFSTTMKVGIFTARLRLMGRRPYLMGLLLVLGVALVARALLLMSGSVSFHSDEAVVALMARHITLGERPVFFYGQAYMGSLDAWVNALGFQLLGEGVHAIRIMQSLLFMGVVASGYHVAWVLSRRVAVAVGTGLLFAVGPVLLALYTTATLGGYNETLIFGHLIVALGYGIGARYQVSGVSDEVSGARYHVSDGSDQVSGVSDEVSGARYQVSGASDQQTGTRYLVPGIGHQLSTIDYRLSTSALALGCITGLAWWTNALIVIYAAPVALYLLVVFIRARQRSAWAIIGLGIVGFFIGSAPWWLYAFQNELAPLRFLLPTGLRGGYVGAELPEVPIADRLIGLFIFGLPAVVGMRFPWEGTFFLAPMGLAVLVIALIGFYRLVRARPLLPGAAPILLGMVGLMGAVFLFTRFSSDPSGRYFLPLTLPFFLAISALAFPARTHPGLKADLTTEAQRSQSVEDIEPPNRQERQVFQGRGTGREALMRALPVALVGVVLVYFAAGQISAARGPLGLTTQFNTETHLPNTDDAALIEWLLANDLRHGYTNFWISFRISFLSSEGIQLSAALPDTSRLRYTTAFERYPPYRAATDAAERVAYITAGVPGVDAGMEAWLTAEGIAYRTQQIGIYRVYYDFAPQAPRPPVPFATQ
jgi:4-amino-4-deoxy-L-arabinose transferase-like glycosyltransferase